MGRECRSQLVFVGLLDVHLGVLPGRVVEARWRHGLSTRVQARQRHA